MPPVPTEASAGRAGLLARRLQDLGPLLGLILLCAAGTPDWSIAVEVAH